MHDLRPAPTIMPVAIDLDTQPTAPAPARTFGAAWAAGACVASVLLGAAVAKVGDRPAAAVPPQMHVVTVTATGAKPYVTLTGAVERSGIDVASTMVLPVGTTIYVWVIGTIRGAEVKCEISIDGSEPITSNGFGIGAVAQCTLPVRDRR